MTTTPAIDVNEAFRNEKLQELAGQREARERAIAQGERNAAWVEKEVAAGRMRPVSEGLYVYTTGWETGEYFRVQRDARGQIAEVVAQHGLDTKASGEVALYSSTPTWHGFGQIIPGGTSDIGKALELAGLDFTVEKQPTRYLFDGTERVLDGSFVTVRTDTGAGLGTVGRNYTVIDNHEAFAFLQKLLDDGELVVESAGSLRGGRSVFLAARLPEDILIEADGVHDIVRPFVVAFNSHDGDGSFKVVTTPWRPVCRNTERFALRDAHTQWRVAHRTNALTNIKEARRTLQMAHKYYESWAEESKLLAQTPMSTREFDELVSFFWTPKDPAEAEAEGGLAKVRLEADQNRRKALHYLFASSETTETCRGTAYAARSAVTEYLDWMVPLRASKNELKGLGRRMQRSLEGDSDDIKRNVHKKLLTLTTR